MKPHPASIRILRNSTLSASLSASLFISQSVADERDDRIRSLEKRVEQLEQLLQKDAPAPIPSQVPLSPTPMTSGGTKPAEAPRATPSLSVGASGFSFRSADTNFVLRLRGLLQLDSRWYLEDGGIADNDGFVLRRARPILEGTVFRDFDFLFTPDFGGLSPAIRDAWLNYRYNQPLQLRIGKMKTPGGLERWQSVAASAFVERTLVSDFWPVRDLGMMLHGELWPGGESATKALAWTGLVNYSLGVFNGIGDGRSASNADFDDGKSVAGRLFLHPFLNTGLKSLQSFGLGLSATYGNLEGVNGLPDLRGYLTEGQQTFFTYRSGAGTSPATANVMADGTQWRLGPQAYWYWGPFGLLGEYGISSQQLLRQDGASTFLRAEHHAWSVTASWMLTGEDATHRVLTPRRSFDPRAGAWGAWQVVARCSQLDIDDDVFPNFADPAISATSATAWGVGLNWYLNRNVRAYFDFNHTNFKGGAGGPVSAHNEDIFLTRIQLSF